MTQAVVELLELEQGIIQVKMQDTVHKNLFTLEMIHELREAFNRIHNHSTCKVVILTGYDNYFSTGGTQDGLLAIHDGISNFADINIYSLALECKVPVIAAMQGHAVGGGFVMGLFSDFVVLSRESIYTANFMRYGFTPGMGATYIIPKKFGFSLGEELLLSGGNYRGAELEKRGIPFPVLPRKEVMAHALELARQLAEKPRFSLITLKDHLVAPLREQLPAIIEQELIMHEKTFHQAEVKERIASLFGK
ncbi:polyketide synthase [Paenibacillus xylaniclasticus]|uniref:polyketide synthase n=1 Tax=Paenibacillus xylaniclasticus TaxID=588083 RepID=UPI000FD9DB60|nr:MULTISPECIES: polyketide synthase [Paenibacillus]GFN31033.1 putative polyketide biosynthesis enoyl-CoA isomerase PksI [Paenibacillus curdlanolyticus]